MELEIINKLFLELSQVATATTREEIQLTRILKEHRDGRLAALEKLAKVTQCAEEMLRCFDADGHYGAQSDWDNSDNEPWDDRCMAACEAMKRALSE